MAFTLPQFRLIQTIHELGSLGRAAPVLGVSQPALSRTLGELERQLGVQLFERHPSGLRATPYAMAVLPYATNVVEEAARALEEVRVLAGESRGVVRIGSVSSAAASFLPAMIERLMQRAPEISLKVSEGVDEFLEQGLISRTYDIIIASHLAETDQIARAIDLRLGDVCTFMVGANHPLRGRTEVDGAELFDQTWVALPPDSMPRKYFERLMRDRGLPVPKITVETRSIAIIRDLVAHQGFITWAPTPLYASNSPDRFIEPLNIPAFELRRAFHVYRLRRRTMSLAVRDALSILRSFATEAA
jgi:DNA-binding transcriptional LysR family regulator